MVKVRIGSGFDVHKFSEKKEGAEITLCGVKVPCDFSIIAHSDGDVALHALTDAVLGAIAEGDIGVHFPPSNPDFKDMNSENFIKFACQKLQERNGRINNVDLTIISETPKVSPYREKFISKLSEMLGVPESDVSVKATTTEKLGFTGRKEGIACHAIICVEVD
jgi:2-C-methyl-D-erythritol 2,4-cyclodiphosphate synthase